MLTKEKRDREISGIIQFFILVVLYYFGLIFASLVFYTVIGEEETTFNIHSSQVIQALFLFAVPALAYSMLIHDTKGKFLLSNPIDFKILFLSILTIFTIQPLVETVNHYNNLIELPESMSALSQFFKQTKESSERLIGIVFADKSISNFIVNILVIALLPGIVEELFFRGCMQRALIRVSHNKHIAIWTTAIIFSILHFQLAGLFPRILLGAMLGYLYIWSGNILVPIIVHTINNGIIVIMNQMLVGTSFYEKISNVDYSIYNAGFITFVSLIATSLILVAIYMTRLKKVQ